MKGKIVNDGTREAALTAAGGDAKRLIVLPTSIMVVNYPGFPVERWTKKAWRKP